MKLKESNIQKSISEINYDYQTIKITQSRIDKGLLAIPKTFSQFLPSQNSKIKVSLDDSEKYEIKNFSSFYSPIMKIASGVLKNGMLKII